MRFLKPEHSAFHILITTHPCQIGYTAAPSALYPSLLPRPPTQSVQRRAVALIRMQDAERSPDLFRIASTGAGTSSPSEGAKSCRLKVTVFITLLKHSHLQTLHYLPHMFKSLTGGFIPHVITCWDKSLFNVNIFTITAPALNFKQNPVITVRSVAPPGRDADFVNN